MQALFEQMVETLPSDFYDRLTSASRQSGAAPEEVMDTALRFYKANLLEPDSRERLREYAARYHALLGREIAEAMTPEERAARASLGGEQAAAKMTPEQKRARASLGGYAAAARMTPERRRQRALAMAEGRRRKREEREREARASSSTSSAGSKKRSRS